MHENVKNFATFQKSSMEPWMPELKYFISRMLMDCVCSNRIPWMTNVAEFRCQILPYAVIGFSFKLLFLQHHRTKFNVNLAEMVPGWSPFKFVQIKGPQLLGAPLGGKMWKILQLFKNLLKRVDASGFIFW